MRRLPEYHVPRRRLTERCLNERVVVGEAAGGYGKSVLGAELAGAWWSVGIDVQLDHGPVSANLLAARWPRRLWEGGDPHGHGERCWACRRQADRSSRQGWWP